MATRTNDLTEFAKPAADYLYKRIGSLKTVLSAGVIALSKLSPEEREKMIAEANGLGLEPLKGPEVEFRRRVLEIFQESQVFGEQKKCGRRTKKAKSAQSL